jgi:hypothetical protein
VREAPDFMLDRKQLSTRLWVRDVHACRRDASPGAPGAYGFRPRLFANCLSTDGNWLLGR